MAKLLSGSDWAINRIATLEAKVEKLTKALRDAKGTIVHLDSENKYLTRKVYGEDDVHTPYPRSNASNPAFNGNARTSSEYRGAAFDRLADDIRSNGVETPLTINEIHALNDAFNADCDDHS